MIAFVAVVVGVVVTALIGLTVFNKDRQSVTSWAFGALALSLIGWSTTTYFSLHTSNGSQTLHWIRWIMFFVVSQNTALFFLVRVFPNRQSQILHQRRYRLAIVYAALVAVTALSPFLFAKFVNGSPQPGPGMALFLLHTLIFAVGGAAILIGKYRHAKGPEKAQLGYFLAGVLLLLIIEPAANFVLPIAFKNNSLLTFGPLYAIVFSGLIGYAIVRKRLFDIRGAVARSVGYVLVMIVMLGIYAFGLFGIVDVFFRGVDDETLRQVLSVVMLMPLAASYQYTKNFFDRAANRWFYSETYDLREVLDKLGDIVASEIDLKKLLDGTRGVLSGALKPSFMEFMLIRDGKPIFEEHRGGAPADLANLSGYLAGQRRELLVTESLDTLSSVRSSLRQAHVALGLRLRTQKQIIGYILVGDKKNGEVYSPQDQRLMRLVADELAVAVQNALQFEEIQSFNRTLQARVDRATRQLQHSNHRLRELDNTKDDFISMASHQLRTPLTSVKGYISLVLDGDVGSINADQRKLLDQAFRSSQQMVFLISDLLNLSRLNTGKFVIEEVPTDLSTLVEEEVDQLSETAKSRGVKLIYSKPVSFPELMLDETKIRQVAMNFMDNAIYYTPSGGAITVALEETSTTVEYTVKDNGIGVPKDVQHKLFSKFYRASNAQKARPDGTGLGLFMAKKVIVAQNGAIIFESQEGKGSTFGFRFNKADHMATSKNEESKSRDDRSLR
jgi:signal transduction histidine kinase